MAHRIITQVVITGTRVFGRAVSEAFKQAQASSAYQRAQAKANGGSVASSSSLPSLEEACKILNVKPPKEGKTDMEEVMGRFKKLFDVNDPKNGGSFYLQSKVLRAREKIEAEVRKAQQASARAEELKEGFKPKMYKE